MPNTTNFNWATPADTDLVKDGALAIRTLGSSIDTSFVDLKGGTTGQVLSKASNTDLDYTWVTTDDANAIQNAIVDAKGDLIAASAADTPARLAVGNNGETLVADSSTTTGLRYTENYAAGKNKIINGDFNINQRSFTSSTAVGYGFDRWLNVVGGTDGTCTFSAQTFTPGAAPVAGYEASNYIQLLTSGQTATDVFTHVMQTIENVRSFAGQTVTVSFWAKAATGTPSVSIRLQQVFGSGGSTAVSNWSTAIPITTSWARYSRTFSVASISGKTIGTNSYLATLISVSSGSTAYGGLNPITIQNNTFDIWGVQVEAGSVATAFQTATGTLAGELAACQRYFQLFGGNNLFEYFGIGAALSATESNFVMPWFVPMRTAPTATFTTASNYRVTQGTSANTATVVQGDILTKNNAAMQFQVASGLTAGNATRCLANNTLSATISVSAEL